MLVIAVDGPAASGKSTLAARIARHYGLPFLDTGLLYRAVARELLDRGLDPQDEAAAARLAAALQPEDIDPARLHGEGVGELASKVAALAAVREALVPLQRQFASRPPGAVLAGRDIGTVICPEACVKLFVTASREERARRRCEQLRRRGEAPIYARVLEELEARDRRDSERAVAPLRAAPDALVLDTTDMDAEAAFRAACAFIDRRLAERPGCGHPRSSEQPLQP